MKVVFSLREKISAILPASHASTSIEASSISFCVALGCAYSSCCQRALKTSQ
jgi:hypothetical protein